MRERRKVHTCLQSTNKGTNSSSSTTTITIEAESDFALSFDYAVSSEGGTYDYVKVTLKNEQGGSAILEKQLSETYSGGSGAMQSDSYLNEQLTAGTYTLTLTYTKDGSGVRGDDRAYISNIVITTEGTGGEQPPHEHDYTYVCNGDGTHNGTCIDDDCGHEEENVACDNIGNRVTGLVASAKNADIINCGSTVTVTNSAGTYAGGILGRSLGNVTISGCFNTGTVTADLYAGGIVCNIDGATVIENCYNAGALIATDDLGRVGGIVATPGSSVVSMTNCYATNVAGYSAMNVGAIVGSISQHLTIASVYYESGNWCGGDLYTWSGTAPTAFTDYSTLLTSLGGAFKTGTSYPWLAWQQADSTENAGSTHTHSYNSVVTAPTCTDRGYTTHTCTIDGCGYSYIDSYTPATGHSHGGAVSNGDGTHSSDCDDCDDVVTDSCTYDSGEVIKEPTHTEAGEMKYTCTVCGYEKAEPIDKLDFASGTGKFGDPFVISTQAELFVLAEKVNDGESYAGVYFELARDIALTGSWTPIGNKDNAFSGIFDGRGYTVSGISIDDASQDFNGLFGYVRNAAIQYVIVDGSINGGSFSAGIAGYANNSTIQYCGNLASVTAGDNHTYGQNQGPDHSYAAGIVGYATAGTQIICCYNRGDIVSDPTQQSTNSRYVGGIVGSLYESSATNCYNTGDISALAYDTYTYAGGIVGYRSTCTVAYCYNTGTVSATTGSGGYFGGISGSGSLYYQQDSMNYYLTGTASQGYGNGADNSTYVSAVSVDDLKTDGDVFTTLSTNYQLSGGGNNGYFILKWETDLTAGMVYITEIYTKAHMYEFMNNVRLGHSYEGETVSLMNDIDLEGWYDIDAKTFDNTWTAIGDIRGTMFSGTFDGQGYTIDNMVVVNNASGYLGLFSVNAGTIKDLTVTGTVSTSQSTPGGIAGKNLGTIEDCVSDINIRAIACDYVGGIAADNAGTIRNCVNYGDINGKVSGYAASGYVGGIAGHVENLGRTVYDYLDSIPVIDGCVNHGDVSGSKYVGGVVGGSFVTATGSTTASASITGCANTGNIVSDEYAGGIVSYMSADSSNFTAMSIANCYNTGNVKGAGDTGGIVGNAGLSELMISNCYNSGKVTSTYPNSGVGAIAGYTKARIENCYYVLDGITGDLVSQGDGSGENYARPISAEYLANTDFVAALGGAYKAGINHPVLVIEK